MSAATFAPKRFGSQRSACVYVRGTPNGVLTATIGTLAVDVVTGTLYQNTTGAAVWVARTLT
jgi:hypothetical protein